MKAFPDLPSHPPPPPLTFLGSPFFWEQNAWQQEKQHSQVYDKDKLHFLHWVPGAKWNVGCKYPDAPPFSSLKASSQHASPAFSFSLVQFGSCTLSSTIFRFSLQFSTSLLCPADCEEVNDSLRRFRIPVLPALTHSISKVLIHT